MSLIRTIFIISFLLSLYGCTQNPTKNEKGTSHATVHLVHSGKKIMGVSKHTLSLLRINGKKVSTFWKSSTSDRNVEPGKTSIEFQYSNDYTAYGAFKFNALPGKVYNLTSQDADAHIIFSLFLDGKIINTARSRKQTVIHSNPIFIPIMMY